MALTGLIVLMVAVSCRNRTTTPPVAVTPPDDSLPVPRAVQILPDSSVACLLDSSANIRVPANFASHPIVTVSGDVFLRTAEHGLTIQTPLFIITVQKNSGLHIDAPLHDPWAQVDVVSGQAFIKKSYAPSETDTLGSGQMEMINRNIDLMEKEVFDPGKWQAWVSLHLKSTRLR
ncbi:hypothetical protein A4H97_16420 [Niastella yeongjuensis]|uniref:FecR protein domain-containing protein n=2 Tax=Niastella yeongjuensis TaxID=354355 RepID=A0A1V9E113_9BACT|nr:hypothetical protein A4H97_16420 [Niastella yeongjuensis]SEO06051.1 hypothetical protein SAMN05660816_02030 [Niastella yeongjuensis]